MPIYNGLVFHLHLKGDICHVFRFHRRLGAEAAMQTWMIHLLGREDLVTRKNPLIGDIGDQLIEMIPLTSIINIENIRISIRRDRQAEITIS